MYSSTIGKKPKPKPNASARAGVDKAKGGVDKATALDGAPLEDTALTIADTFNETFSGDVESSTGPTSLANTDSNYGYKNCGGGAGKADDWGDNDGDAAGGSGKGRVRWLIGGTAALLLIVGLSVGLTTRNSGDDGAANAAANEAPGTTDSPLNGSGGDGNSSNGSSGVPSVGDFVPEKEVGDFSLMVWSAGSSTSSSASSDEKGPSPDTSIGRPVQDDEPSPDTPAAPETLIGRPVAPAGSTVAQADRAPTPSPFGTPEVAEIPNTGITGDSTSEGTTAGPTTAGPTSVPTTAGPTKEPTKSPSLRPSTSPSKKPTPVPTVSPITPSPSKMPTAQPSKRPTDQTTDVPTRPPTPKPTRNPNILSMFDQLFTSKPTSQPTRKPTSQPTLRPTSTPTSPPTPPPTRKPTLAPTPQPTGRPTLNPTPPPTLRPTSRSPTEEPTPNNPYFMGDEFYTFDSGCATIDVSRGLTVRLIAETGSKVKYANGDESKDKWHTRTDAAGIVSMDPSNPRNSGYAYLSNSEEGDGNGGVYSLYFDKDGNVIEYTQLLKGTTDNCGGGLTPWNTFLSCEEFSDGMCWQCDAISRNCKETKITEGGGRYESVAVDNRNSARPVFFTTEDHEEGALRRFIADGNGWDSLHGGGDITYLEILDGSRFRWTDSLGDGRDSALKFFPNTEGIQVHEGKVYFMAKKVRKLLILDLDTNTYKTEITGKKFYGEGDFGDQPDQNMFGPTRKYLYFTEDGGRTPGVFARYGDSETYFTMFQGRLAVADETVGIALSPDHTVFYAGLQDHGCVFEFRREDGLPFE